jgi:hypothetical protein
VIVSAYRCLEQQQQLDTNQNFNTNQMNQHMSIRSSELTPAQQLNLTQVHFSSAYDLRTHQQPSNQQYDYELRPLPLEENEHRYVDLPNSSKTIHIEVAHQNQLTDDIHDNSNTPYLPEKHYKQYLINNSNNKQLRLPQPHVSNS